MPVPNVPELNGALNTAELFAGRTPLRMGPGLRRMGEGDSQILALEKEEIVESFVVSATEAPPVYLPLQCRVRDVAGTLKVTVEPSTVLGEMPKIGGTRLDAGTAPTLTLPSSGTRYVVLNFSLTMTVDAGFVFPVVVVSSLTISVDSTAPTSDDLIGTSGTFKALLATYTNGVKTGQTGYGPVSGELCDTLTGEGKATLVLHWGGYQA